MKPYVLVTYSSKYGSTQQIAEKIGDVLTTAGLYVDVEPIEQAHDLKLYTAVVLGSAVYAGQWLKEAVTFLTNHEAELAKRSVWLFSSGPTGAGDPVEMMNGWQFPEGQRAIAERIHPQDTALFHGVLDLSKLNLFEKLLIKGLKSPLGDFRDWDAITEWATHIAETLTQTELSTH